MNVLGLMSGTSCDGLDCCDADIQIFKNYKLKYNINKFSSILFTEDEKSFIMSLRNKKRIKEKKSSIELTKIYLNKIENFALKTNYDLISCHGQTISHIDGESSIQLLNPSILYAKFNVPIIYNFRYKDIDNGGNGAPLMPFLDWLLFSNTKNNVVTLNIGGISNISFIPRGGLRDKVLGFDTGPGMCLIDKVSKIYFNKPYDKDGTLSRKGNINKSLLDKLMLDPFIYRIPPKSTDIQYYFDFILKQIIDSDINIDKHDLIRTLVEYTIDSITYNILKFVNLNVNQIEIIYSGGGTEHPLIIEGLKNKGFCCKSISSKGIDSSIKEAFLMAVLGFCRLNKIDSNMISATGAKKYLSLGDIYDK